MRELFGTILGWVLLLTLTTLFVWGVSGFIAWDWNPAHWSPGDRLMTSLASCTIAVLWRAGGVRNFWDIVW